MYLSEIPVLWSFVPTAVNWNGGGGKVHVYTVYRFGISGFPLCPSRGLWCPSLAVSRFCDIESRIEGGGGEGSGSTFLTNSVPRNKKYHSKVIFPRRASQPQAAVRNRKREKEEKEIKGNFLFFSFLLLMTRDSPIYCFFQPTPNDHQLRQRSFRCIRSLKIFLW